MNTYERQRLAPRVRERGMQEFQSVQRAQQFLGADSAVGNLFNPGLTELVDFPCAHPLIPALELQSVLHQSLRDLLQGNCRVYDMESLVTGLPGLLSSTHREAATVDAESSIAHTFINRGQVMPGTGGCDARIAL